MFTAIDQLQSKVTRPGFGAINRLAMPAVKAGLGTPLLVGVGLVVLETTGRVSGQPRQVPLVGARFGRHIKVSTLRSNSQWAKNLEAQPEVAVWVGGHKREASSSVKSGLLNVASLTLS